MRTLCEKCIFADYADSPEPCKMKVLEKINKTKHISDNNFYTIEDYRCIYAFNLDVYEQNKKELGNIEQLKNSLTSRAYFKYYMVIKVDNIENISNVIQSINLLTIPPRYISFILNKHKETKSVIDFISSNINANIGWKLHNFLEPQTLEQSISTIFDTNSCKNDTRYFWVNTDEEYEKWGKEIQKINHIITIEQPKCFGLFRSNSKNGMFLSFKLYKEIKIHIDKNIYKALDSIEDTNFIYYA